ncbi:MAG: roadblock/LC7 domain-containing protein [Chloroflexota bacterium]|nr:roadblock/LC7 domain-containing protein [Chloroflexota bacterium]
MSIAASRTEALNAVLDSLALNLGGDVLGSAVVSVDGIVFAARFSSAVNIDRLSAIAATVLGVSRRVAKDLIMGNTRETIIQCDNGYFVIYPVNEKCLLAVNLRKGGNLGMVRLESGDAADRISGIMS